MVSKSKRTRMSAGERREQLIEVARGLFATKGFDGTSIEEIAARAKVSKPVVYEHFGGKEGLYAVIVDRELNTISTTITRALGSSSSASVTVERAALALLSYIEDSPDGFRILSSGNIIREHALYRPILVLVALGALTKSAQFPFLFWLPRAMAAPTPVSAYLHSATMVKLGVFLLARLWVVLSGTDDWFLLVCGAGAASLLFGAFLAMFQTDLKGLLAYSSISHLG